MLKKLLRFFFRLFLPKQNEPRRQSKGEYCVEHWLKANKLNYIKEYRIKTPDLVIRNNIFVDFYVPDLKWFIEFNGEQHYKPVAKFGGYPAYISQKHRDEYLRNYAKSHNYHLTEIRFDEFVQDALDTQYNTKFLVYKLQKEFWI